MQVDGNGKLEADQVPIRPYSVEKKLDRPRIVVLGSGWGAMSFIKAFKESDRYLIQSDDAPPSAIDRQA